MSVELVLATGNRKKIAELAPALEVLGVRVLAGDAAGVLPEVTEDRPSFAGNAEKKAIAAASATGRWALADDSGLEVDALEGAPGVASARFAGRHGDDAANNALLLERLAGLSAAKRGARFVCALALARPDCTLEGIFEGTARGRILEAPRGGRDFGYDPLFLFTEEGFAASGHAFAELEPRLKAEVSHRGRALARLIHHLSQLGLAG